MRVSITTLAFTAFIGLVSADSCAQQPVGTDPTAGILAISSPDTTHPVTAGSSATIVWSKGASTASTVSIVLCQGPSTNCVPIACIKNSADNNAQSYTWSVPTSLAPSGSSGGYGLKIIEDGTGRFQYSTQFGVLNPNYVSSSSTPAVSSTAVSQISDGQIQAPTYSATYSKSKKSAKATGTKPFYAASGSVSLNGPYPTTGAPKYYVSATGKISNTTHSSGYKFSYGPNTAPAGALQHTTQYSFATGAVTVPSSAPGGGAVTQTAVVGGGVAGGAGTTGTGVAGSPSSTTAPLTKPSGAASKVVAGGLLAGLGAIAAFIL